MPPPTHIVHDDEFGAAALSFDQRVADHPRARHAVGVADRDRAAVDVELVVRDAEPVAAIDAPGRRTPRSIPTRSMSSILRPCCSNSLGTAKTGPIPISSGAQPATAMPR